MITILSFFYVVLIQEMNKNMTMSIVPMMLMISLFISSPTKAEVPQDLFILAGQSNMAGRGGVVGRSWDGFVPHMCQPSPNILSLSAQDYWVPAHEPLHSDIDFKKTCGVGPGMAFANSVRSLGGSKIGVVGLVPCAVGGTKISEWARGSVLYNQMVTRAKVGLREGGIIRAVLWYQGESDTVNVEDARAYKGRMEKLIADLRSDLDDPSLLIIQVCIHSLIFFFGYKKEKLGLVRNIGPVYNILSNDGRKNQIRRRKPI